MKSHAGDANRRDVDKSAEVRAPLLTPTVESERRIQATKSRGRRVRQVTQTTEGATRKVSNSDSGVGEAHTGNRKEWYKIQAGDQK